VFKSFLFGKTLCLAAIMVVLIAMIACNQAHNNTAATTNTLIVKKDSVDAQPIVTKFTRKPFAYDSTKKYIYLTFDDGPQNGTMQVFDLCKKLGVKATFFMIGEHAADKWGRKIVSTIREAYPDILLANHSYTHANNRYVYFYQHHQMAEQDFYRVQDSLDIPYKIVRLPGNSAWATEKGIFASKLCKPVTKLLDSAGYSVMGWDTEWRFNQDGRPIQSAARILSEMQYALQRNTGHEKKHIVLLTHDRMFRASSDLDSLAHVIKELKKNANYVFETMDHYPGIRFQ
jgi:peptidoglycan-N-acetylglucosamine deacetylase